MIQVVGNGVPVPGVKGEEQPTLFQPLQHLVSFRKSVWEKEKGMVVSSGVLSGTRPKLSLLCAALGGIRPARWLVFAGLGVWLEAVFGAF